MMIRRVLLTATMLAWWAVGLRAEMWCSRGPLTALDHPCESAPKAAVAEAIRKYREEWMGLSQSVWKVESATRKNGSEEIMVYVDPTLDFTDSTRKQIPSSVEGIPVVILPDRLPSGASTITGYYSSHRAEHEAEDAADRLNQEKREASERAFRLAVHKYGSHWLALPGVLGIGPDKCTGDGCDFSSVGITVQRRLLDVTRSKVPNSAGSVPIVLIPQD